MEGETQLEPERLEYAQQIVGSVGTDRPANYLGIFATLAPGSLGEPPQATDSSGRKRDQVQRPNSGNANTNRLFPALGRSSRVSRSSRLEMPDWPVLTATYWRPSTA